MENKSFLLDTQILLWILNADQRINEKDFKSRFEADKSDFYYSQISLWEIQIKYDLKKLALPKKPGSWLVDVLSESGFQKLPVQDQAIFSLFKLPSIHRDPFDRLLISHALVNNWTVISSDEIMESYPINVELI